ncbi:MAG: hypothetical protein GY896_19165 [Gammaproteobacteria bacterium]|nr:hypothetical protein [Gammaproteobacteria bacterium]
MNNKVNIQLLVKQWYCQQRRGLGLLMLCFAVAGISGCEPGSDSGGGIDPGVIEIPVAFIKRPILLDDMGNEAQADVREPRLFMAGGDVYLRTSSTVGATVTNITISETLGTGDVKGLNASHNGKKIIFSLRLFDPDPNDDIVPSWNIFQYDLTDSSLTRIIPSLLVAEEGDDLYPSFLPDGRILFTSNRQRQSREMLINEGKPRFSSLDEDEGIPAMVLHVMNADGTDIHQISFNQSHDLYPQVLTHYRGGRVVFSRWDNAVGNNEVNLYTANPDGSDMDILYGSQSHLTGTGGANVQFTNFREMENGDLMVITKPFDGTFDGGDIIIIDADRFADNNKPIWSMNGLPGPGQVPATISNVNNAGAPAISVNGRYSSAFPLWDGSNRILVSKSTCQLELNGVIRPCVDPYLTPAAIERSPAYSIWLYDMDVDTQKPIVLAEQGRVITEVITVENRTRAPVIFDKGLAGQLNTGWETDIVGVVNIKSVYDMGDSTFNGCYFNVCTAAGGINSVQDFADPANAIAAERPARFVRFIKPVGIPDPDDPELVNPPDLDNTAFGLQRNRGMREIVGYAPVEPDGSVKVKVPANIPLSVEVLDGEGRRIGPSHNNWFQVQPGDTLNCVGCHDLVNGGNPPEIHARSDGEAPSINSGVPVSLQLDNTLIPGTVSPNPYLGALGQTLAEVRFDSVVLTNPPTIEPQLSADLVYDDYWTDPDDVTLRAPDASYAYRYTDLDAGMLAPTNTFCSPWVYNCRVAISYAPHIHAIFQLDRGADVFTPEAPANPAPTDPTNTPLIVTNTPDLVGDDTCISCHTSLAGTRLPYGQLDLTSDPNQDPNDFLRSYVEMFINKPGRMFDGANLVPFTVLDGMGNTINNPQSVVSPTMTTVGARSSYFIEKMSGTELDDTTRAISGSVDHSAMLTGAELRLISEWIDLGAQNFNDPFDPAAPQN